MVDSDAIYNYTGKIKAIQRQFKGKEAKCVSDFLNALADFGLSKGRITYYACRLPKIMKWFRKRRIALKDATKEDCKQCLRDVNSSGDYGGETKSAYAKTLKRLIHFAKTSEIGEKEGQDYVQEVAWIRPTAYLKQGEKQEIKPSDILTYQELEMLVEAVHKISRYPVRDTAMVICMYEGAFRPGELLRMTIGGILFKDKVAVISTTGKTGSKTVPLLLSYRPLLEWLEQHPQKDDPDAAVWMGMTKRKVLHYQYLRNLVKDAAREAGIKKKVWNYLLRHTRLTDVAKKHPDQILKKYGNWKGNTRMMEVYIHLSESDLEDAVLREHGLQPEEKEEANARLNKEDEMKREFVNIAAHELRTPVLPIMLNAESLTDDLKDDKRVAAIIRNAKRLTKLTNDILQVSRIESRSLKISNKKVEVDALAREAIENYRDVLRTKEGVEIEHISGGKMCVNIDKDKIVEVLSNIIDNAIKFTPKGTIKITTSMQQSPGMAVISVRDAGSGIHLDIIGRLFQKFATKSDSGTGLGLYIAKGIIEAHGGRIWGENNKDGPGATFGFNLPLAPEEFPVATQNKSADSS